MYVWQEGMIKFLGGDDLIAVFKDVVYSCNIASHDAQILRNDPVSIAIVIQFHFFSVPNGLLLSPLESSFFSSAKSDSVIYLNQRPIFYWYVVKCDFKNRYQKDMWFKRVWTTCSKRDNHSRLNSQHNWEDLY